MRSVAVVALATVLQVGCSEPFAVETGTTEQLPVSIAVSLNGAPTITAVRLTVTAPDFASPITQNLSIVNGVAQGTVSVPSGLQRTFKLQALDAGGVVRYEGSKTVDVVPGPNPSVAITLMPLDGQVPIIGTIGT